jgi:hypothetical protein
MKGFKRPFSCSKFPWELENYRHFGHTLSEKFTSPVIDLLKAGQCYQLCSDI